MFFSSPGERLQAGKEDLATAVNAGTAQMGADDDDDDEDWNGSGLNK